MFIKKQGNKNHSLNVAFGLLVVPVILIFSIFSISSVTQSRKSEGLENRIFGSQELADSTKINDMVIEGGFNLGDSLSKSKLESAEDEHVSAGVLGGNIHDFKNNSYTRMTNKEAAFGVSLQAGSDEVLDNQDIDSNYKAQEAKPPEKPVSAKIFEFDEQELISSVRCLPSSNKGELREIYYSPIMDKKYYEFRIICGSYVLSFDLFEISKDGQIKKIFSDYSMSIEYKFVGDKLITFNQSKSGCCYHYSYSHLIDLRTGEDITYKLGDKVPFDITPIPEGETLEVYVQRLDDKTIKFKYGYQIQSGETCLPEYPARNPDELFIECQSVETLEYVID